MPARHLAVVGIDQLEARDRAFASAAPTAAKALSTNRMLGAAIAHGVLVLQRAPADVERHDHGAGPAGGQIKFEIAVGIERQDRDAVAGLRAERADAGGQPRDAVADLAPVFRRSPQTMARPFGLICSARRRPCVIFIVILPCDLRFLIRGGLSAFLPLSICREPFGEADREFVGDGFRRRARRRAGTSGRSSSASPQSRRRTAWRSHGLIDPSAIPSRYSRGTPGRCFFLASADDLAVVLGEVARVEPHQALAVVGRSSSRRRLTISLRSFDESAAAGWRRSRRCSRRPAPARSPSIRTGFRPCCGNNCRARAW